MRWRLFYLYASLTFVLTWLAHADLLAIPSMRSWPAFWLSLVFLCIGFASNVWAWQRMLRLHAVAVSTAQVWASVGLTIFGKYIPGKLWVVMGRASYLADSARQPLAALSMASLHAQLITLWVGLPLGALAFLFATDGSWQDIGVLALGLWALLSAFLLSDAPGRVLTWGLRRLGRPAIQIPLLSVGLLVRSAPWFLLVWLSWCAGFALLVTAFTGEPPRIADGLAFVLAATLAVLALIAPGGLGVREGLLVLLLVMLGQSSQVATTLSVVSRLWFLCGEVLLFMAGLFAHRLLRRASGSDN